MNPMRRLGIYLRDRSAPTPRQARRFHAKARRHERKATS